ncbi:MAG: hypothetical protein GX417_02820 [Clostridiales bacterium]|nr:hypothetical protein [Clostridiales bacterium]
MVDQNYFSKINGGSFELGGDAITGKLYHWIWDNSNITDFIGEFLVGKGFKKGRTITFHDVKAEGEFSRVEMQANSDSDEIRFNVEYFDGKSNCISQIYTKPDITKRINVLTCITIIGTIASIAGVVLGILGLSK